jgi:hypothetical protein
MWDARAIVPFVAAAELVVEPEPAWRAFVPPRVLVLIVAELDAESLVRSRPWLAETERVVIVRDRIRAEPVDDELRDPLDDEWRGVLASLPHAEVFDWVDLGDAAPCRAAIARALEHSHATSPRPLCANPDLNLPPSAWVEWNAVPDWRAVATVASQLAIRDGHAWLVAAPGGFIDLAALGPPIAIEVVEDVCGLPLAGGGSDPPGRFACGVDPVHPIAWRGHRMAVYWMYRGATELGFLTATDHDYPCGPAKKLWGYADNDPIAIAVTPTGDICAQTFEHDVLLTVGMPIGWHRAGAVDVAAFVRDPRRAVLYAQTAEFVESRATDDLLEENNRDLAPVVVLGPDRDVRYAVDLQHRVVRITATGDVPAAAIVGGPDAGYAVFDADHRIVRRGVGRLLGGWFRHATIEDDGWLWREDLATGARTLLGSAVRTACLDPDVEQVVQDAIREGRHEAVAQLRAKHPTCAIAGERHVVAIPGTRNIIELAERYLRVL